MYIVYFNISIFEYICMYIYIYMQGGQTKHNKTKQNKIISHI